MEGGSKAGMCKNKALVKDSSEFEIFDALIPKRIATLVN